MKGVVIFPNVYTLQQVYKYRNIDTSFGLTKKRTVNELRNILCE